MAAQAGSSKSLAVISDLHVGDLARSADLSGPATAGDKPDGYIDEFAAFVSGARIAPDLLLIPGDITDRAHPVEFQVAGTAVERLTRSLGLSFPEDIVLVPGNHDVSWKSLSQFADDSTSYSTRSRYYPLRFRDWPFDDLMQSEGRHLCEPPYFAIYRRKGWLIVAFNSSSHDGPLSSPDKPHFGLAPDASLRELDEALTSLGPRQDETRVFLVHHHVVARDERARDRHDPSLLVNSADLLDLLGRHSFDLVVHGHKHVPAVSTHITASNTPLTVFGAGSFSATINPINAGPIQNYFHCVEVDGRHPTRGNVLGRIRSWAYVLPEGWQAGSAVLGIDHVHPYGCHVPVPELVQRAQAVVADLLSRGTGYVDWREVMASFDELQYLGQAAMEHLIGLLCAAMSLRSVGSVPPTVILVPV